MATPRPSQESKLNGFSWLQHLARNAQSRNLLDKRRPVLIDEGECIVMHGDSQFWMNPRSCKGGVVGTHGKIVPNRQDRHINTMPVSDELHVAEKARIP